jgi:hypothetical protein
MSKEHAKTEEEQPEKTKKFVSTSRRARHVAERYIKRRQKSLTKTQKSR